MLNHSPALEIHKFSQGPTHMSSQQMYELTDPVILMKEYIVIR